jgi:hypothetical protein
MKLAGNYDFDVERQYNAFTQVNNVVLLRAYVSKSKHFGSLVHRQLAYLLKSWIQRATETITEGRDVNCYCTSFM